MKALPSRTIKFRNLVGAAVVRKVLNNKKTLAKKKETTTFNACLNRS
jgi:hypothetical protein